MPALVPASSPLSPSYPLEAFPVKLLNARNNARRGAHIYQCMMSAQWAHSNTPRSGYCAISSKV